MSWVELSWVELSWVELSWLWVQSDKTAPQSWINWCWAKEAKVSVPDLCAPPRCLASYSPTYTRVNLLYQDDDQHDKRSCREILLLPRQIPQYRTRVRQRGLGGVGELMAGIACAHSLNWSRETSTDISWIGPNFALRYFTATCLFYPLRNNALSVREENQKLFVETHNKPNINFP